MLTPGTEKICLFAICEYLDSNIFFWGEVGVGGGFKCSYLKQEQVLFFKLKKKREKETADIDCFLWKCQMLLNKNEHINKIKIKVKVYIKKN